MTKKLYIAEKPDMGSKIAKQLPGPHKRGDGFIETGDGIVTWVIGHLLSQANPEEYDEKYKKWRYSDLPIIPQNWKVEVTPSKSKQVKVIKNLLKDCDEVVNAGDPEREGQLIVDEILYYLGNKKPVWRLLLNSLDAKTIKKSLNNLQPNSQFFNLYQSALGRQRADWLIGLNMTRAYTVMGQEKGYQGVLSVGRVQTPTLAIVVRREEEILNFKPEKYYTIYCQVGSNPPFKARYVAPKIYSESNLPDWLDNSLRIKSEAKAIEIINQVKKGANIEVVDYSNERVSEPPPLPFELSDIQSKMNAKYGASLQDTLSACQKLYEGGYASYPRTDCPYLPTNQFSEATNILSAISKALPELSKLVEKSDSSLQSPAWNDAKMGEHNAIIPTNEAPDLSQLTELEKNVYMAISLRYLAQFYPPSEVDKVSVELESNSHRFIARGRVIQVPGWREVYSSDNDENVKDESNDDNTEEKESDSAKLPEMKVGDKFMVLDSEMIEKETKPPPRYSEGTLITAMKHVDKLVSDPAEKKILKQVKGIGRSATRTNIINTLIKRGFLEVRKKQLYPSEAAKILIKAVDKQLIDPGLTARWEQVLDMVATGKITLEAFLQKQETWIKTLVSNAQNISLPQFSNQASGTQNKKFNQKSKPGSAKKNNTNNTNLTCVKCNKPMIERTIKNGPKAGGKFFGCSGFPNCKETIWPK